MRHLLGLALSLALLLPARAEVIRKDGFETLDETFWTKGITKGGSIEIVDGGVSGKCLRIAGERGSTVYLTAKLDPARFAGLTLKVSAQVKIEGSEQGEQVYSTPKLHFGMKVKGSNQVVNAAERWTGTFDWTLKSLTIEVDPDAETLVLDVGNQGGSGTMWVDDLVLEDTLGQGRPVQLLPVCNVGRSDGIADDGVGSFIDRGMLDLYGLPVDQLETDDGTFYVPQAGVNGGQTVIALRGLQRPKLPAATEAVALGQRVGKLLLLHAASWADTAKQEPVYTLEVTYADGQVEQVAMLAGRDVGNYDAPAALPNWKLAWTGEVPGGQKVGVGYTVWTNPRVTSAIKSLRFVSAGKGVPLILAVTYTTAR